MARSLLTTVRYHELFETASLIVEKAKRSDPTLNATLKEPAFVAVTKQVPDELVDSSLKELIPKCIKTAKCDASRTFKVYFKSRKDLDQFLQESVKTAKSDLPPRSLCFCLVDALTAI